MTFTVNIKGIWMETLSIDASSQSDALAKAEEYASGSFVPNKENYSCHEIVFSPTGESYTYCAGGEPQTIGDWTVRKDGTIVCEPTDTTLYAMDKGDTIEWNYPSEQLALHAARRARLIGRAQNREYECALSSNNRKITITRTE